MAKAPDWRGRTVCCIASGPSLTQEDCNAVREAGWPTVVVNTTFRMAPWADILFGFDAKWWRVHIGEVKASFGGRLIGGSHVPPKVGPETTIGPAWFSQYVNSGACAVSIALAAGAARIILLGYDCAFLDGRKHWHGDHPKPFSNCASMSRWPMQFKNLAKQAGATPVINCSRQTALTCFKRAPLESELALNPAKITRELQTA